MTKHIVSLMKSKQRKKPLTLKRTISLPDMLINNNNNADLPDALKITEVIKCFLLN